MDTNRTLSPAVCKAVEVALESAFQTSVRLIETRNIPLSQVFRCTLESSGESVPGTVIIRFPRGGTVRSAPDLLSREREALIYLSTRESAIAPRFYAGGVNQGYVVSEDLGSGPSMLDLLLGNDLKAAEAGVLGFAHSLGRLHVATLAGAGNSHKAELPHERVWVEESWEQVQKAESVLGLPLSQGAERDIASIARTLEADTGWLALSSGDPSVVNCKVTPSGIRFFDFEAACFRHVLIDAAVLRFFYPTGGPPWQLPAGVTVGIEAAYRAELARACSAASDSDAYERAMIAACAAWMLLRLERLPRVDAGPDSDPWTLLPPGWIGPIPMRSRRQQLVSIIETWVAMANRTSAFEALAAWCECLIDTLRVRWPEAGVELPVYPAFR